MNTNLFSIGDVASVLIGAGITKLNTGIQTSFILIGAGILLKVLVAVLQKNGVPISSTRR